MEQQSNISSKKKIPKGKGKKEIIINLYKNVKEDQPDMEYKQIVRYLAIQTGIGPVTVSRTILEYKKSSKLSTPQKMRQIHSSILERLEDEDKESIRRKVYDFWFRREIPTIQKVVEAVNEDDALPNLSVAEMFRILKGLSFRLKVRCRNSPLIDKNYIVVWRQKYVEDIKRYRAEGRQIYYLGETWINAAECRKRMWVDETVTTSKDAEQWGLSTSISMTSTKGKQIIVGHVGSEEGFVPGALLCFEPEKKSNGYHDDMDADTFFDWFRKLLPMLKKGSVIVLDNAPYHSMLVETYPTMSWTKSKIISWLLYKGEQIPTNHGKARLMELVKKHKIKKKYVIDEYAKQNGMVVLRLPPYHCELNPFELVWAMVKGYVRDNNTSSKLADVKRLLVESVEKVSADLWKNFVRHAMEQEDRFEKLDHITDELLDENPQSSTYEESDFSSDDSE